MYIFSLHVHHKGLNLSMTRCCVCIPFFYHLSLVPICGSLILAQQFHTIWAPGIKQLLHILKHCETWNTNLYCEPLQKFVVTESLNPLLQNPTICSIGPCKSWFLTVASDGLFHFTLLDLTEWYTRPRHWCRPSSKFSASQTDV